MLSTNSPDEGSMEHMVVLSAGSPRRVSHAHAVILPVLIGLTICTWSARAHEPLFGLGPHTIWKYGYAVETKANIRDDGWVNQTELLYGITPDMAVTVGIPVAFPEGNYGSGIGDVSARDLQ